MHDLADNDDAPSGDAHPSEGRADPSLDEAGALEALAAEKAATAAAVEGQRRAERAAERQARLQAVTAALAEALTPEQISQAVLKHGAPALEADAGAIALFRDDRELELAATVGYPQPTLERERQPMKGGSSLWDKVRAGAPLWIRTREELFSRIPALAAEGNQTQSQSWAFLPLHIEDQGGGFILFGFSRPRDFPEEERACAITLAAQCAQALDRARLYQAERAARMAAEVAQQKSRRLAQRFEALAEASRAFAEAGLDLQAAFDAITRFAVESLGDACVLTLASADGQQLRTVASYHANPEARAVLAQIAGRTLERDKGSIGRVFSSGKPVLIDKVEPRSYTRLSGGESYARRFDLRSILVVPLRVKGRVIGTLGVNREGPSAPYDEDDCAFLQDMADRAALAIENARLYEETQRALRARDGSFALLDTLFANAPVGLGFVNRELRFERVNDMLAAIDGISAQGHIGRTLREILPDLASKIEPLNRRVLESGEPLLGMELSGETRAGPGQTQAWLVSYAPVRQGEEVMGIGVVVVDITERKRAEERSRFLAEASALLTSSLDSEAILEDLVRLVVPRLADWCSIELVDGAETRQAAVAHVNPEKVKWAWELRRGYPTLREARYGLSEVIRTGKPGFYPDLLGSPPAERTGEGELPHLMQEMGLRSAMVVPMVARGRSLGAFLLAWAESNRHYGQEDLELALELARRAALAMENARLYEAERRAADRLARLQQVTAALSEVLAPEHASQVIVREGSQALGASFGAVMLLDPSGIELRFAGEEGTAPQVRSPWHRLSLSTPAPMSDAARTREPIFIESLEDWNRRYPALTHTPLGPRGARVVVPLMVGEKVFGALGFSFDGERRFSDEDRAFATSLARQGASALERARLFKQTQDAVRLRDDFLSIAGHELKTPLTALQLQLQGVGRALQGGDVAKLAGRLGKTEGYVARLSKLINELLDVSRITAGRLMLELEPTDLAAVVREVCARFADEAQRIGSEVRVLDEGPIVGLWDRLRLEQIVTNLLSNALKYGAGRPVEVTLVRQEELARLEVRDQGIGIEPAHQARIFGRFERAVSERNYGGFGLGLWIVRQLLQALGGHIRLESQPGMGSTFTVELPLSGPRADPVAP